MQCMVYGCMNSSNEGRFVNGMCKPCYELITKGVRAFDPNKPIRGTSFIHIMYRQLKDYEATISRAREALKPGGEW